MLKWTYVQSKFGEYTWEPVLSSELASFIAEHKPELTTVLRVDRTVEGASYEETKKIKYEGPLYFDWDCESIDEAIEAATTTLIKLEDYGVDMHSVHLYATGGRGFHAEIPQATFMTSVPKSGIVFLPAIYKEIAYEFAVPGLDLKIYSMGRGRMWRQPNVERSNGRYKVPISWEEMCSMTPELYLELCSAPRSVSYAPASVSSKLMALFDRCQERVKSRIAKLKPTPDKVLRHIKTGQLPSLDALLEGRGVKEGEGFQAIALQLATIAVTIGWSGQELVEKAKGLIDTHHGDSTRYRSGAQKAKELQRMFDYVNGNPCYAYHAGAMKSILNHDAPDLQGLVTSKTKVEAKIAEAEEVAQLQKELAESGEEYAAEEDEYDDIVGGMVVNKNGVYVPTEDGGPKKICGLGFSDVHQLLSTNTEDAQVMLYKAQVYAGGKAIGQKTMEATTFHSLTEFNRYAGRYAHAMQGAETHVRSLMMRLAQDAKKNGRVQYVTSREGVDVIRIPAHPNPELRGPHIIRSSTTGVEKRSNVELVYVGYPSTEGVYKSDLHCAEHLDEWIMKPGSKELLADTLKAMVACQSPNTMGKLLGWYVAAFYRPIFHELYDQFPLLHVYGDAGSGKTATNRALLRLHYLNRDPKEVTPASTPFAIQQVMAGTSSIPLLLDEYKPHVMNQDRHNTFKALFRDAYNMREVSRGGGTRENADYRSVSTLKLSAPMAFVAEASETETAVMERVVTVSMSKAAAALHVERKENFDFWVENSHIMSMIGAWISSEIVYSLDLKEFKKTFDLMLKAARRNHMLHKELGEISEQERKRREGVNERTLFNYTVTFFGVQRFIDVIKDIYEDDYAEVFGHALDDLESHVYDTISSAADVTQAEWAKVLNVMALMTNERSAAGTIWQLIKGEVFSYDDVGGQTRLTLVPAPAYFKYAAYCKLVGQAPLFPNPDAFKASLKNSAAYITDTVFTRGKASVPAIQLNAEILSRMGVDRLI